MKDSTVLFLRGGGADAKRREARRRKFAHLQKNFPRGRPQEGKDVADPGISVDEERDSSTTKVSKRRKLSSSVGQSEESAQNLSESGSGEHIDVDASEDKSKEKSAKTQRFICFVGQYGIFCEYFL